MQKKRFSVNNIIPRSLPSLILLSCVAILSYLALVQPWSLRQETPSLQVGDVAPQDIRAPRSIEFVSEILTEEARAAAERAIEPIYAPIDTSIAREQSGILREIMADITDVRQDPTFTTEEKRTALENLENITLTNTTITYLIVTSNTNWDAIQNEALTVLERVMRNSIRSEEIEQARQSLLSLVSLSVSENESAVVVELVSPMVTANSFYSPELTAAAREAARSAVQAVTVSYRVGEMVIEDGQLITDANFEALNELGLIQQEDTNLELVGAGGLVILSAVFSAMYLLRRPDIFNNLRSKLLLGVLFLVFLVGARFIIPNRTLVPYMFPIPAFALLVSLLFSIESGIIFSLILGLLTAYGLPTALDLIPFYILSSIFGVLVLGKARRVGHFLWAAGAIAGAGAAVIAAFRLPFTSTDWLGITMLVGAAVFNGIASTSLALLLQYILAQILGMTTALQLLEISRPDYPLLQMYLRKAPGTYQHSLQVMNLAEQAAESIGADSLLVRVGAIYHDIGKTANAAFFVENQVPGDLNTHDDMDPIEAAEAIILHVADGVNIAQKHRLPRQIIDFISEHHGTLITRYQFNRAIEAAGNDREKVDPEQFRYPGPKPQSRETALVMFADGVEARTRAERPKNEQELAVLVRTVIERCQKEGQLEDTPLTQKDLKAIGESFVKILRGTFHPRVKYPKEQMDIPTTPIGD